MTRQYYSFLFFILRLVDLILKKFQLLIYFCERNQPDVIQHTSVKRNSAAFENHCANLFQKTFECRILCQIVLLTNYYYFFSFRLLSLDLQV